MKIRTFTILIVSKGGKAPRSFTMNTRMIQSTAIFFLFTLLLTGTWVTKTVIDNQNLQTKVNYLAGVEAKNRKLSYELNQLENEVSGLRFQMADLDKLTQQVRGLTEDVLPSVASRSSINREYSTAPSDISQTVSYLQEKIPEKAAELESLIDDVVIYKDELARTPDLTPVEGRITSPYGWRRSPFSRRRLFHYGIDIGAPYGTPIRAAAKGVILHASYQRGYGNLVIIDHGKYTTYYAHMSRITVTVGDIVEKGEQIGKVGSTGYSTGPHLHFEIHHGGSTIDPQELLI